jgi:hypothetical protein
VTGGRDLSARVPHIRLHRFERWRCPLFPQTVRDRTKSNRSCQDAPPRRSPSNDHACGVLGCVRQSPGTRGDHANVPIWPRTGSSRSRASLALRLVRASGVSRNYYRYRHIPFLRRPDFEANEPNTLTLLLRRAAHPRTSVEDSSRPDDSRR